MTGNELPRLHPALDSASLRTVRRSEDAVTVEAVLAGPAPAGGVDPEIAWLDLAGVQAISGFTSSWGLEFEPVSLPVDAPAVVEVTSGRSTQGAVPWLALETRSGVVLLTVHWSGNWRLTSTPGPDGIRVDVALHPDGQRVTWPPDGHAVLPQLSVATGSDRTTAAAALTRHLAAQVPSGPPLLTEWNHWWPYEDAEISEDVFLANAALAARSGFEVAVLDAGWFGRSEADSDWVAERGDWGRVNAARFPHGLAWLADRTREHGIDFGIWIEAEAVGGRARIREEHPELLARGDGGRDLGYVCLGSPAGRDHLYRTVAGLVEQTRARWVKWDFNLDPGTGCRREDHGHDGQDGLLRHYLGLYAVLDQLRAHHPEVVLEACSSGGLRLDAGLAAHVDAFFLSDPDWTEHHLTCLWGAAQLLPARQLLHWGQSEWRGEHRFQKIDYSGTLLTRGQFDTAVRAALLHRFGMSVRLTEMRPELRERLTAHLRGYREVIRPLLESGLLRPLTPQPLREERGCRQPAFQLSAEGRSLVAAFRLAPTGGWDVVRPVGLDGTAQYSVALLDGDELCPVGARGGADLLEDGLLAADPTSTSAFWVLGPL